METSKESRPSRSNSDSKAKLRTVADVEVGSAATSVPATEQDRADFQKLMKQMNGLSVVQKESPSSHTSSPSHSSNTDAKKDTDEKKTSNLLEHSKNKKRKKTKQPRKKSPPESSPKILPKPLPVSSPSKKSSKSFSESSPFERSSKTFPESSPSGRDSESSPSEKSSQPVPESSLSGRDSKSVSQSSPSERLSKGSNVARNISEKVSESRTAANTPNEKAFPKKQGLRDDAGGSFHRNLLMPLKAAKNLIMLRRNNKSVEDSSFCCIACDRTFPNIDIHLDGSKKNNHLSNWKYEMRQRTLDLLPDLTSKQVSLLDSLVTTTVRKCHFSDTEYNEAHALWQSLNEIAKTKFDCSVRWFGSHVNRIALADNKLLNMDLLVQNKDDAAVTFLKFISAVEEKYEDVERVVASNFTHANVCHKSLKVQLSLNNNGAYQTAKLIGEYVNIDERVRPLCLFFRHWGKVCGVDQGENGSWQGHAFPLMVIHFLQQKRVLPVLHEMVENPEGLPEIYLDSQQLKGKWTCQNKDSVGQLLFDLFAFYAAEHDVKNHIVCITQFKPFLRMATKWNAKRIAVMDPFQPKHNISRYISANMYDYVHFCLVSTACVLGIPRTDLGPLYGYISPRPIFDGNPDVLDEYKALSDDIFELVLRVDSNYIDDIQKNNDSKVPQLKKQFSDSAVFKTLLEPPRVVPRVPSNIKPDRPQPNAYISWWVTPFQAKSLTERVRPEALKLDPPEELYFDKETSPLFCTSCHKNGHKRSKCPDEVIPIMKPLPPPSKELIECLSKVCIDVFESRSSEDGGLRQRVEVRDDILNFLRHQNPDVDLQLFGSSLNGFGGRSSDIDMCLTFHSNPSGEGLNFPQIVERMEHLLRNHQNVHAPLAITTAKVPIVKFTYGRSHIQVDISLYNRLGIMNTKLLHAYSVIDPRVRPLVYMMKNLAKTTGIGDASRGSLSSYGYSLMTLYFLQQVDPPIIPVLQELHDPNEESKVEMVDGANVYFFRNLEKLDEVWPYRHKNKSSLGELWLQLLEFYASEKFHKSQQVVCIRKKAPLYKFDKLWTSTNICIEDPFDLNHNLGSGLSKRMNIFIVKTLQKALQHFSTFPQIDNLEKYYFNEIALSVGNPPSDRGCHFCRSIGHVQVDCPKRLMAFQRRSAPPAGQFAYADRGNKNGPHNAPREAYSRAPNRRGNSRNEGRDHIPQKRDPNRISNMPGPLPMYMPGPVQRLTVNSQQRVIQDSSSLAASRNSPKPMNVQNHVVVGSVKPPGFRVPGPIMPPPGLGPPTGPPTGPPGFPMMSHPVRMMGPQMVQSMPGQVSPQLMQGLRPPVMVARPFRPFNWQ